MTHDFRGRLARAGEESHATGIDALIVTPSADLQYLAGYDAPLLERLTALIARSTAGPVLLVPELERPRAAASPAGALVDIQSWHDGDDPYELLRRFLPDRGTFAVSDRMWAAHLLRLGEALPGATFVTTSAVLSKLRRRKDRSEIDLLGKAAHSADASLARIAGEGLEGRTEEGVARSLARHLVETGCDAALFWIVGSGPNGASPHHEPGERSIQAGDMVVLDFGGRAGGYCSDLTRTVSVGEPSAEAKEVHEIVRQAQEAAFQAVKPGVPAEEVDRAARRVIDEAGYGKAFFHRTGHGIGLEEHEPPYIVEGNTMPLEPGMCFSIEPGIYLESRFGVRIEDIVTVTDDGAERLNHASRDLMVVG
ncbi:MAG TPA: Xaa-Pro peptidase family protein [Actinomycetota bacterium]